MSDLTSTRGPWYVNQNGGAYEIVTAPFGGEVIGMFHDEGDAVVASCGPTLINALIDIQEIAADLVQADERERIMSALSEAFGKIYQEAS